MLPRRIRRYKGINSGFKKVSDEGVLSFIASAGFLGYVPIASGTFGTLAGIILFLVLSLLAFWGYLVILSIFLVLAIFISTKAEQVFGRKDDGRIVIDEVAGYLVTMIGFKPGITVIILGFLLFRASDVLKPWPARTIDRRCPGGLGVVLDDVAAAIYSFAPLHSAIKSGSCESVCIPKSGCTPFNSNTMNKIALIN